MLSFTLSGKHMSYAYTQLKHKTITDIRIFRHSYNELIQLLRIIQTYAYSDLYLSQFDLILTQILHSWQTYSYSDLPKDTYLFRFLVYSTELIHILILVSRRTHTSACIRRILIQISQRTYFSDLH